MVDKPRQAARYVSNMLLDIWSIPSLEQVLAHRLSSTVTQSQRVFTLPLPALGFRDSWPSAAGDPKVARMVGGGVLWPAQRHPECGMAAHF